jgi:hypothetical protein
VRGGRSERRAATIKTFPKGPNYDFQRPTIFSMRDEAAHRARVRQVGLCFSASLLPDLEHVVRGKVALMLNALVQRRGKPFDMHHWSRAFSLDFSSMSRAIPPLTFRPIRCSLFAHVTSYSTSVLDALEGKTTRAWLTSLYLRLCLCGAVKANSSLAGHSAF